MTKTDQSFNFDCKQAVNYLANLTPENIEAGGTANAFDFSFFISVFHPHKTKEEALDKILEYRKEQQISDGIVRVTNLQPPKTP